MKSVFEFNTGKNIIKSALEFDQEELLCSMLQCPVAIRKYFESLALEKNQIVIEKSEQKKYSDVILKWLSFNPLVISNNYELRSIPVLGNLKESSIKVFVSFNPICAEFLKQLKKVYIDYKKKHPFIDKIELKSKYSCRLLKYLIDHEFATELKMSLAEISDLLKVKKESYPALKIIELKIIISIIDQFKKLGIQFDFKREPENYARYGIMKFEYREFYEFIALKKFG